MPAIRKIQSRDVQALSDTFPEQASDYFENLYIEHLQDTRTIFVVSNKDSDGSRVYYGYVCITWESTYTQFWRRNIPEITDLFVHPMHRRQGLATKLISACEDLVRSKNYGVLGISVLQAGDNEKTRQLYETLGYTSDDSSISNNRVYLLKNL